MLACLPLLIGQALAMPVSVKTKLTGRLMAPATSVMPS